MNRSHFWLCLMVIARAVTAETGAIPLSLKAAIETGLRNNPELKLSAAAVRASGGRFWSSISPPPAEFSAANDYVPAGRNLGRFGEQTIGISQAFEFPVKYIFRGSQSRIETEISRLEYAQARLRSLANIKSAYFRARALQEQVKIAEANLEIAGHFAKKAEIRRSVGDGTGLEALTAKVQYTQALNGLESYRNRLVSAFADLNCALGFGKDDKSEFVLTDSLGFPACGLSLDSLVNDAARANPQLKICTLREEACAVEKKLAWSGLLPDVTLGVFSKKVRGDAQDYWGASAGLTIPVWLLLDQRGKIHEASANVAAAGWERRAAENAVFRAVKKAWQEFWNAEKQVALYRKDLLPQAEEIYRAASKSYEAGESTYIEFLQAQQTVAGVRSGYVDAVLDYNLSIAALEEAVGKGHL